MVCDFPPFFRFFGLGFWRPVMFPTFWLVLWGVSAGEPLLPGLYK